MRISQPRCTHCRCNARTPGAARAVLARAEQDGPPKTQLEILVRRKQSALAAELDALGMEGLSEKLSDAMANPAQNKYRLGQVLSNFMPQVRFSHQQTSQITSHARVRTARDSTKSAQRNPCAVMALAGEDCGTAAQHARQSEHAALQCRGGWQ